MADKLDEMEKRMVKIRGGQQLYQGGEIADEAGRRLANIQKSRKRLDPKFDLIEEYIRRPHKVKGRSTNG